MGFGYDLNHIGGYASDRFEPVGAVNANDLIIDEISRSGSEEGYSSTRLLCANGQKVKAKEEEKAIEVEENEDEPVLLVSLGSHFCFSL